MLYLKYQKASFDVKELQRRVVQDLDLKVDYLIVRDTLRTIFNLS